MTPQELCNQLMPLNPYEAAGKQHTQRYGTHLSYLQYIYLRDLEPSLWMNDLAVLYTAKAVYEQQQIQKTVQSMLVNRMLSEKTFIKDGSNLEIEKLLRYVDIPPHAHDFVECSYVFCGECIHRVNDREFVQRAGSFVTIPYGYVHSLFPNEDCLCITVKIRNEAFVDMKFPGLINFLYPLAFDCSGDLLVPSIIAALWEQQERNDPLSHPVMQELFKAMMFYINQQFRHTMQVLISGTVQDKRVVDILSFMLDHYRTVTLQSVADHFHYSPAYLSRLFHQHTGKTFSSVLREYKLSEAAKLLQRTDKKLNEICELVGYKDCTQFILNFKELYGTTPAKFRKDSKQNGMHFRPPIRTHHSNQKHQASNVVPF